MGGFVGGDCGFCGLGLGVGGVEGSGMLLLGFFVAEGGLFGRGGRVSCWFQFLQSSHAVRFVFRV